MSCFDHLVRFDFTINPLECFRSPGDVRQHHQWLTEDAGEPIRVSLRYRGPEVDDGEMDIADVVVVSSVAEIEDAIDFASDAFVRTP